MDTSVIAGTLSIVANNGLGFAKFLNRLDFVSNSCISATDSITDQIPPSSAAGALQLSAALLFPVATVAPPPVKSISRRSASRTFLRRKRRTKRRLHSDDSEGGEDNGFGGGEDNGSHGGGAAAVGVGISIDLGGVIGTNRHRLLPLLLIQRIISFTRWFVGSRSRIVFILRSRRLLDLQPMQLGTPKGENCR